MTDWRALECAYGSAERVPDLLRVADEADSDFGDGWDDLWSHLCHQGTVYSASYAAIPALTAMCLQREPRGYLAPLQLVGAILASNDGPDTPEAVRGHFSAEADSLRELAERCLERAADDTEFMYGLETFASFDDGGVWSRSLSYVASGEAPLDCPSCGENLLLHIDELPATVSRWDASQRTLAVSTGMAANGSIEARLLALAAANDRPLVEAKLQYIFGRATCPACAAEFLVADALA